MPECPLLADSGHSTSPRSSALDHESTALQNGQNWDNLRPLKAMA